jgi:hypothetical protein
MSIREERYTILPDGTITALIEHVIQMPNGTTARFIEPPDDPCPPLHHVVPIPRPGGGYHYAYLMLQ